MAEHRKSTDSAALSVSGHMIETARSRFAFTNDLLTLKKPSMQEVEDEQSMVEEVREPVGTIVVTPGGYGTAHGGPGTAEARPDSAR